MYITTLRILWVFIQILYWSLVGACVLLAFCLDKFNLFFVSVIQTGMSAKSCSSEGAVIVSGSAGKRASLWQWLLSRSVGVQSILGNHRHLCLFYHIQNLWSHINLCLIGLGMVLHRRWHGFEHWFAPKFFVTPNSSLVIQFSGSCRTPP